MSDTMAKVTNRVSGLNTEPAHVTPHLKRTRQSIAQRNDDDATTISAALSGPRRTNHYAVNNHENTYKLDPDLRFSSCAVERITESVLIERLKDEKYDASCCKELSQEMAAKIMDKLKALKIKRYKMVALVSIGSVSERPGMQFGSRCLWNEQTDSFASVKFTNGSLFAVAMVYGLYFE